MLKELKRDKNKKGIVFAAMSGGVDSSVAALLLKKQGYDVVGVFMRCWSNNVAAPHKRGEPRSLFYNERDGCAERDAEDARRVAEKLKIPFYIWDFEKEYKEKVVEYMIDGYKKGITPNPDVMCNKEIKFGLFLEKALEMGELTCRQAGIYLATGHYVQLASRHISRGTDRLFAPAAKSGLDSPQPASTKGRDQARAGSETFRSKHAKKLANDCNYSLFIAKDNNKDQSYFLWTLTQEQLKHCLFPIGDYLKSEVREIARKAGLPTAEKKDSQGICFLGKVTLDDFLKQYIPEKRGKVLSANGKILGEHKGAQFYTVGQRHLKINQQPTTNNQQPFYVTEKNVKTNTVIVAEGSDNPALYKKEIELTNVNFINQDVHSLILQNMRINVLTRVRYRQPLVKAKLVVYPRKSALKSAPIRVLFETPQKAVAPGQSAVFYSKDGEMLGGGIIDCINSKC